MPSTIYTPNVDTNKLPHLIAVEGCIGVGKTSLAKRLAQSLNADCLLEQAEENPFLTKFYQDPKETALATQLFFLFQRVEQLKNLRQHDLFSTRFVADFIIDKDPIFAKVNLSNDEFKLYQQVYDSLNINSPAPDLVIYLQAPVDVLIERIQMRGRRFERYIDARYLEHINRAYSEYFYYYNASPLLIINVAELDLVNNDNDFEQIVNYALNAQAGRHYLNPTFFSKPTSNRY